MWEASLVFPNEVLHGKKTRQRMKVKNKQNVEEKLYYLSHCSLFIINQIEREIEFEFEFYKDVHEANRPTRWKG